MNDTGETMGEKNADADADAAADAPDGSLLGFEFVLENDNDSTTRVLTPRPNQTVEELLRELQIVSGQLQIRRVAPSLSVPSAKGHCSPVLKKDPQTKAPLVAGTGRVSRDDQQEGAQSLPPAVQDDALDAWAPHPQFTSTVVVEEISRRPADDQPEHAQQQAPSKIPISLALSTAGPPSIASTVRSADEFTTPEPASIPRPSLLDRSTGALNYDDDHGSSGGVIPKHRHRRRISAKRTSMRDLTQLDSLSDAQGQTMLHRICASSHSIDVRRVNDIVERFPDMVKQKDSAERLPLHVLSSNSDLINSYDGQKAATKCALLLMDAYPEGIVTRDADGRMPFTYLVLKWVEWAFDHGEQNRKQSSTMPLGGRLESTSVSAVISKLNRKLQSSSMHVTAEKPSRKGDAKISFSCIVNKENLNGSERTSTVAGLRDSMNRSSNRFPPVLIFDEVEWCFEMLSYGMDHLGGKPLDPGKKMRPTLAYDKQREQRNALAQNLAEIPWLLKTVLLVESKHTRSFVLGCSAIRRTLFCKEIIGPWLTIMIRYTKGTSSEVALNFLQILSRLKVEDYIGGYRKAQPKDEKEFHFAKLNMYKAVEKLGDVIPTLLIVDEGSTNKAVATPLVCFIMNRQMSTPFTVGTGIGEFLLHLTSMLAFRQIVLGNIPEGDFFVHFPWMSLESVIFWVATHELSYKLCEFVALSRISKHNAKKVAFGWWSIIEILGIVLALWAAIWLDKNGHNELERPFVLAFILGLLWLRMLGFLKVVNEQLATFILAVTRMLFDIRFFAIVLFIFVLMFGDMFNLVVSNDAQIDCSEDDLDPAIEEFCSRRNIDAYLRTYAIVVGDFELSQYNGLEAVTFLWFCTTFLGTIVMLNILIAIVTLSYASSHESSIILFRRARAQFLASHSVMEKFIRPSLSVWSEKMSILSVTFISLVVLRWILLLTWLTGTLWSSLYIVELVTYSLREHHPILCVPFIVLAIAMFCQLWCTMNLLLAIAVEQTVSNGKRKDIILEHIERTTKRFLKTIISGIYGMDRKDTESGEVAFGPNTELLARLDQLETLIQQIVARQEREEEDEMEANFEDASLGTLQEKEVDHMCDSSKDASDFAND